MSVTTKSTRRIKGLKRLPTLPAIPKPGRPDEPKEIEAYIRSLGGKPLSEATRQKLIEAGCYDWPQD